MEFLINYWDLLVALVAIIVVAVIVVVQYLKSPRSKQMEKVREWLLLAVIEAEKQLGGGTGKIKLRYVYDLFIQRFRFMSLIISFEKFAQIVDEALEEMRHLLETNNAIKSLVVENEDK